METFYLVCAVAGGTLIICQFVMSLIGIGHGDADAGDAGHDVGGDHGDAGHDNSGDHHGGHSWFVGVLTFRSVVAALTFVGLGGMTALTAGATPLVALFVALAAGAGALFLVASLMRSMTKLQSDGTVRIEKTLGHTATVYLGIPGGMAGAGKVTVVVQQRTMEYLAKTQHGDLPTGSHVQIISVLDKETLEVQPLTVAAPREEKMQPA
jgi:hypothetical protein